MTTPTKAQEAIDDFWSGTTKPNKNGLVSSTINSDTVSTIREALSLLHRVQSGEVKALGREPLKEAAGVARQAQIKADELHWAMGGKGKSLWGTDADVFSAIWDAAPAKPDSDGV